MITEALVEQRHARVFHQRTMLCPHCQRLLPARPDPPRTVHTLVGEVSPSRPYFYCIDWQKGFYPLDDALQLSERRKQWNMQKAGAILAAEVPFETAQERFAELTGLSLSDHTVHEVAGELGHERGVLELSPTAAEIAEGKTGRLVLGLAIDGALIPEDQVRLCVIGDGAKGIWNQVKALLPTVVQILDDYYGREPVHQVGGLQFGDDPERKQEWVEAMMARLCWGDVDWAIDGLEALQPRHREAAEEIRQLIGFLRNNGGRLHYRDARKGGCPIGSGGIEAANTCISHVRLKRSGAWWYVEKANHMPALGCATDNGTCDRVVEAYNQLQ